MSHRHSFAVFNRAGDKEAARADWKKRFNNRVSAQRTPGKLEIRAAASDTTEILFYDEVGYFGISSKDFATQLATITTPKILLRISSPGGDAFDGLAIYNSLLAHPADISTVVDGLAASAASFIALAGDTISMHESAMMMVHRAWGIAIGNQADMADMANTLQKIDGQLAGIYAKQTGKPVDEMLALMTGESDGTWLTADEAAALGMIDAVIKDGDATASKALAVEQTNRILAMRRRLAIADHDD